MSTIKEKVAYLKGLTEGMDLPKNKDEVKIFAGILDVLGDMAAAIEEMELAQEELAEDLMDLEDDVEELNEIMCDEYDDYDDEDTFTTTCEYCGVDIEFTPDEVDEDFFITCPACKQEITIHCNCDACRAELEELEALEALEDTQEEEPKQKGKGKGKKK